MSAKRLNVFAEKDLLERSVKVSIPYFRMPYLFIFLFCMPIANMR